MKTKSAVPYGSDASGGVFACADCGYGLQIQSTSSLPPCPHHDDSHTANAWSPVYGRGDAAHHPRR